MIIFGRFLINATKSLIPASIIAGEWLWNKIKGFFGGIVSKIKGFFKIGSPSRLFADEIGDNLALGIGVGFEDEMQNVTREMQDALPTSFDVSPAINGADYSINGATGSARATVDMISAFKEALSEMKIVLDDEVAGQFVERTVTRAIYA